MQKQIAITSQAEGQKKENKRKDGNGNGVYFPPIIQKNPTLVRVNPDPLEHGTQMEGIAQKVFLDRYSLKDDAGAPLEKYPEQMWRRIAKAVSRIEKTNDKQKEWEGKFCQAMQDFKFVPGGRILAGAGTGFDVTYYNCYVLPSPKDSRHGIMENLAQMIDIMARGGGAGINLSSLRPRGARVKKVNGFSSGPMNWAELYSVATHDVIQQGGTRRGALMLMLWDWHPDIEEFITIKKDLTRIPGANLSVCVSDRLMEAVKRDEDWPLLFPDLDDPEYDAVWDGVLENWIAAGKKVKIHKTIRARYLWDLICEAAWTSAEPGLHFMERTNKLSSTWYFNRLICTNPCVTGDTLVTTNMGMARMGDLYSAGRPFMAVVDGKGYLASPPVLTGIKRVYKLHTLEGYELRLTEDHKVYTSKGMVEAGKLIKGDKLLLSNRGAFGTRGTLEEGRVWGWLVGDGSMKKDRAELFFYQNEKQELAPMFASAVSALVSAEGLTTRNYSVSPVFVQKENKAVVKSERLHRIATRLGFAYGKKHIVPESIFMGSETLQRGFLQGLFSSDGCVCGTPDKGVSVRLTSISIELLVNVQRLLTNFGIISKIYYNRRTDQKRLLPDGKGGKKLYNTKAYHDLIISKDGISKFAALIGFLQEEKQEKLRSSLAIYERGPYKASFLATFDRLEEDGIEDVFDITVSNVHRFTANGIVVSNCGEEPLPPYGVCNLGSLNLAAFVNDQGEMDYESLADHTRVAVRFLDNVVDGDIYIFEGIREAQLNGERRIGVGTMGLGDALIKMKIRYGSDESIPVVEKIYKTIRDAAFDASVDTSREKGAFPKFDKEKYLEGEFIKQLPEDIRTKIKKQGVRNAVILMQAPTGSTSLMAGVTSGIEPVYEFSFTRRDRIGEHKIYHPLYQTWKEMHPDEPIPSYFVSANDLIPEEHIKVQAAVQKYVDASISKTVNAPNVHTIEDVKRLYSLAYELGCKGITYMREGSRPGVLSREEATPKKEVPVAFVKTTQNLLVSRPEKAEGVTYRVVTPTGTAFITINRDEADNPLEVFINIGRAGSDVAGMAEALGRLISAMFRIKGNTGSKDRVWEIVDQLSGIGGRRTVGFGPNKIRSLPDAIAIALARHFGVEKKTNGINLLNGSGATLNGDSFITTDLPNGQALGETPSQLQAEAVMAAHNPDPTPASAEFDKLRGATAEIAPYDGASAEFDKLRGATAEIAPYDRASADICPQCGALALVHEEGCSKCYSCGHAEC
ncbi:MAG: hypothetical protein A2694_02840 [Candidatus Blackburnbacteria bacterium RIFCSPHIGHO2_01_FULL_40_17]|nr:MAG: hypothetical protein A2694_02840 [Candidatus Blackburnbacteria bacterium RIFCSPHIGHO2_01_FULL_40_17]